MTTTGWVILLLFLSFVALCATVKIRARRRKLAEIETWKRHNAAGLDAYEQGDFAESKEQFVSALYLAERIFEPMDPRIVEGYNNLAKLLPDGSYALIALAAKDVIKKEEALGPYHPDLAYSLEKLSGLYKGISGGYGGLSQRLSERVLVIRKRTLGAEHPLVAKSLDDLTMSDFYACCSVKGFEKALKALTIREKALGPDHPDVARSLENIAGIWSPDVLWYFEQGLAQRERALGADNPEVARDLENLARFRSTDVLQHLEKARAIRERALGSEHPSVASTLHKLGEYYCNNDRHAEAEPLFRRALEIREEVLGPEHPDVAVSLTDLVRHGFGPKAFHEAESLVRRSIVIWTRVLSLDLLDPDQSLEPVDLRVFLALAYELAPRGKLTALLNSHFIRRLRNAANKGYENERLSLVVELDPLEFNKGKEVSFERVSVSEERITLLKLVTKPASGSDDEKAVKVLHSRVKPSPRGKCLSIQT